jgi:hypothetical protein
MSSWNREQTASENGIVTPMIGLNLEHNAWADRDDEISMTFE